MATELNDGGEVECDGEAWIGAVARRNSAEGERWNGVDSSVGFQKMKRKGGFHTNTFSKEIYFVAIGHF